MPHKTKDKWAVSPRRKGRIPVTKSKTPEGGIRLSGSGPSKRSPVISKRTVTPGGGVHLEITGTDTGEVKSRRKESKTEAERARGHGAAVPEAEMAEFKRKIESLRPAKWEGKRDPRNFSSAKKWIDSLPDLRIEGDPVPDVKTRIRYPRKTDPSRSVGKPRRWNRDSIFEPNTFKNKGGKSTSSRQK
jgi:hypothetical protein